MIELPDGENYGIAIKFGKYDKRRLIDILQYIQEHYQEVTWCGDKPMEFIPDIDDYDFDSEDINDFVLFIENDNELAWGSGNDIDSEYSCYDYIIYTPCEFMNDDEDTEIDNEMDVSFLFN